MKISLYNSLRCLFYCSVATTAVGVIAKTVDLDGRLRSSGAPMLVNPSGVPTPEGYSHIAIVPAGSELVILAGQIGEDAGGMLPSGIAEQYRNAAANVIKLLRSENIPLRNIVKMNTYIVAAADTKPLQAVHTALDDIAPTATLLYVSRLAHRDAMVEIEVFASRAPRETVPPLIPPRDFGQ